MAETLIDRSREMSTYRVTYVSGANLTDEDIECIIEMAGYGIAYWATEATGAERHAAGADTAMIFAHYTQDSETREVAVLTKQDIVRGFELALNLMPAGTFVHGYLMAAIRDGEDGGIDAGHIDSDAADVIIQFALFGELVYG